MEQSEDVQRGEQKNSVLVVENHQFFRENLIAWIATQKGLVCCAEAATVKEAEAAIAIQPPGLILLDLTLDEGSGIDLLHRIEDRLATIAVIVLSQYEEERYAEVALEAGARGYVSKPVATEELQPAIEAVLRGLCYVSGKGVVP